MPATAFSSSAAALAAILVHSIVPVASNAVGCQTGLTGLLLSNGFQIKPNRNRVEHKNHVGLTTTSISTDPALTLSIDAKTTALDGPLSTAHPGKGIDLTVVTQYSAAVAHGFPTDSGCWFELMPPSFTAPAGDLSSTQFELRLWAPSFLTGGTYIYAPV